jgi:hypothetical protein
MKRINLFICAALLCTIFAGCFKEDGDRTKDVEMTMYAEPGYGSGVLSDVFTEQWVFSESDDTQKRQMTDILTEGFDFDRKWGYEYTFTAKKVWMSNPPQDVSSVKYIFAGPLTGKKVITENSEKEVEIFVHPETVKYTPRELYASGNKEGVKVYDALLIRETDADHDVVVTGIDGFDFERGYGYKLSVNKITSAEPYSVRYILLEIKSRQKESAADNRYSR